MHHLFQVADERQHREDRLHQHPVLPLAALTQFEVAGIPLRGMEAGVAQDDHPSIYLLNQPLKGGRCFRGVDLLSSIRGREAEKLQHTRVLSWFFKYFTAPTVKARILCAMTRQGKQRYRCRQCLEGRGRTFLLAYSYAGQSPDIKQQIVDMAMNASGIRDTARVLHVSPTTVLKELKKRHLNSSK
jgi:InsA-like protein